MRRALALMLSSLALAACSHAAASLPPTAGPPGNNGGPPPTTTPAPSSAPSAHPSPTSAPTALPTKLPTPLPTIAPTPAPSATPFNTASVHITEHTVPVTPLYVAAASDHAAYFGFGANGTGGNLYRYYSGALVQTAPAAPPSGYTAGGGVYGITVTNASRVFWLSAYFDSSYSLYVDPECGGSGGTATLCEPTVDEPTSMVVDRSGTFWIGGLSFSGGGEIVTSSRASTTFNTAGVMQLINGPGQSVWGVLADSTQNPEAYSVAQFAISGTSISMVRDFALPSGDSIASITVGGDGNFWFTDTSRNAIGRMDLQGSVREFALPSANALPSPWYGEWQIAAACDGAVWFSEPGPNKVARMDASGGLQEFTLPSASAQPMPVASVQTPGHKCIAPELWVGEEQTKALAEISF